MFRNPRENANIETETPVKPSTGRPPTPPNGSTIECPTSTSTMSTRTSSTKPLTPRASTKVNTPTLGRQGTKQLSKSKTPSKIPAKPNSSILKFFQKVENPLNVERELFIYSKDAGNATTTRYASASPSLLGEEDVYDAEDENSTTRYHENGGSVKRRKLSSDTAHDSDAQDAMQIIASESLPSNAEAVQAIPERACSPPPPEPCNAKKQPRRIGAFVDGSDSEDEAIDNRRSSTALRKDRDLQAAAVQAEERELQTSVAAQPSDMNEIVETMPIKQEEISGNAPVVPDIDTVLPIGGKISQELSSSKSGGSTPQPQLFSRSRRGSLSLSVAPAIKKEDTTYSDFAGFEDVEEFGDDEYDEGEEFVERKWMREQARLEALENGEEFEGDIFGDDGGPHDETELAEMTAACPICDGSLVGISAEEGSRHVNACLDGKPIPLPKPVKTEVKQENGDVKLMPSNAAARFSRSAIPRPGQANPFQLGETGTAPSSAFSKLMSSKAEDAAWANAAAAENAARGKPAYQRVCPFYKIMPGFYICVDAFRYGAVQGCKAYFLSHFHSDHYIGLTSSWCHGPIYCSKVTGNLVKQQLRVDPKWVVQIDFESRIEVPGTQGVTITMIPANHCPGSSLFLFEKVIGKGASPKVHRVLHCGDFRACPAHIAHPLLMPDIVDSITGKTKQQKIDVCYLDTTYLNPRYAFPCQEDVIKACADMCVSLRKDRAEEGDAWEQVKKERAGAGMVKFIDSGKIKEEDDSIAMTINPSEKPRGRLLVICGTYSIGKERICMGIARALDCKIWAAPGKMRICAALEDPELQSRLTDDPREAQIHMQMLMEIRAETLQDYLNGFKPHFSRIVGFRPSGWNYRPPNSRFVESPAISTVLNSENWKSRFHMSELVPQRGSTREASCFGVPYSEHSSFRELTMFCCALRIEKIIPTVNVGSAPGRAKMKAWIERWLAERRKNGPIKLGNGEGEVKW